MGPNKRKLGPKPKQVSAEAKEREQDTIREINKVLDQKEVRPMLQLRLAYGKQNKRRDRCCCAGRLGSAA